MPASHSRSANAVHPRVCGEQFRQCSDCTPIRTVHPRVCGEQRTVSMALPSAAGSSPRLRGTECRPERPGASRRFIPASAGNRQSETLHVRAGAVHPRVCGEQERFQLLGGAEDGSSPRLRGTVGPDQVDCDEAHYGSSPRLRGTETGKGKIFEMPRRFIPASAGNRHCKAF